MQRRHFNVRALSALGAAGTALTPWGEAFAEPRPMGPGEFPNKPIRIIVPYPAGGVVDVVMRAVANPLSEEMPQRVIVENRTGADGRIGLTAVAQAPADGYTLLSATPLISVGEHLMAEMAGRSKDFTGVCGIAAPPAVFVVWSGLGPKTMQEFIALAKSKPGEFNAPNPGTGSSNHLGQELLFDKTGIKLTNVNYRGQPPSLTDLADGRLHFGLIAQSLALPMIQSGKFTALAVNAAKRTRSLPNVPTIVEAGLPDVLVQAWYGIAAPAKTPAPVVDYLGQQFLKTLSSTETRTKLEGMDAEVLGWDKAQFNAVIASEFNRWGDVIKRRDIKMS
jgi:tripartite-type tricarboxylate transporter receptor subunit TctC